MKDLRNINLVRKLWSSVHIAFFYLHSLLKFLRIGSVRKNKVLHVSIESHQPLMLTRQLRKIGWWADFLNVNAHSGRLDVGADYRLPSDLPYFFHKLLGLYFIWWVMPKYEVIHVHFNTFFTRDGIEYRLLKRLGKILVFHYRGCDLRHRSLNVILNPILNCCTFCDYPAGTCDTELQYTKIRVSHELADISYVTTPDLLDFTKSASHLPFILPLIDAASIAPAQRDKNVFRVVTSSNHLGIDGVPFIRDAVLKLKSEGYGIELVEVSNTPFVQALAIYKSADVYVGKLRMGFYNNANIETMMMGIPNMAYIRPSFLSLVPDAPIINTRPDQVYDNLKYFIMHRDELRSVGLKGPEFVKKYHNPDAIALRLSEDYKKAIEKRHNQLLRV